MDKKVQEWLGKEETFIPYRSTRRPTDVYTICDGSEEPRVHVSATSDFQRTSKKHYHTQFPSSGNSVIPFAEPEADATAPLQYSRLSMDARKNIKASILPTSEEDISLRIDGRKTIDFQRRPRHKMRDSGGDITKPSNEGKGEKSTRKEEGPKKDKKQKHILTNEFPADNLTKERLTLRPSHLLGIYKKGRSSLSVKNGLPDLAFSEMKFLGGEPSNSTLCEAPISKRKRDHRKHSRRGEKEISAYFDYSKKHHPGDKSDVMTISSDSYTEHKKRFKQTDKNVLRSSSPESLASTRGRHSPRSAMANILRRKGVYSMPANLTPQRSDSDSNSLQAYTAEEGSKDGFDEHSEYPREGFQARFRTSVKDPAYLHESKEHGVTVHSSTSETLEPVKEGHNNKPEVICTNVEVEEVEEGVNTSVAVGKVSGTLESIITTKGLSVLKSRCTPEPSGIQKFPGSSSPLAALLRVCADSPIKLSVISGKKVRQGAQVSPKKLQIININHSRRGQHQTYQNFEQPPGRAAMPISNIPNPRDPTPSRVARRGWGGHGRISDDWDLSPEVLHPEPKMGPLYCPKQQKEIRSPELPKQQILRRYPNEDIFDSNPYDHVAHNQEQDLMLQMVNEGGFEAEDLDKTGQEWSWEVPNKYTDNDNIRLEFADDSFIGLSPEFIPDGFILENEYGKWDEERKIENLEQLRSVVHQHQTNSEHYLIENGCFRDDHTQHKLEKEVNQGLKRENFWRRHRLG